MRKVTRREGHEDTPGYLDFSKLVLVESENLFDWKILGDVQIKGSDEAINKIDSEKEFMGLQDPDILVDKKGLRHVYFTTPMKYLHKAEQEVYLGRATGKDLSKLVFKEFVLGPIGAKITGFKELASSPISREGSGIHLAEIEIVDEKGVSAIAAVESQDYGGKWKYLHLALNPRTVGHKWCSGFVSPCRILPKSFIDSGNSSLYVTIINGRVPIIKNGNKRVYGDFLPGLALYNPQTGEIPWVAPEPLFKDPAATTITFASEFVQSGNQGILYAHPNDSFVRAYRLNARNLKKLIPRL